MAIDDRNKRFSMIGFGSPVPTSMPLPDGTISENDRAMLIWLYHGFTLGIPAVQTILTFKVIVDDILTFTTEVDDILTFTTEIDDILTFDVQV